MTSAWQALRDGGVPLAGSRSGAAPDEASIASAALAVLASGEPMTEREADALAAFLRAWQHHFADSFRRAFGPHGPRVEAWADAHVRDVNRYLKLRRIAIENLARVI